MKKIYTTSEYKSWNKRKIHKIELDNRKYKHKKKSRNNNFTVAQKKNDNFKPTVYAPSDFRLIENTEACLLFFRSIRSVEFISHYKNYDFVLMSLTKVAQIDYGTVSLLTSISDDLKYKKIILRGDFPINPECKQFIEDSGLLQHMVDENNRNFPISEKSEMIFFEKGCGKLSEDDNKKISKLVKNVIKHLSGESKSFPPVKSILLEICGNSIEHAYTNNNHWLLGVKYEPDKVIFTVTDVGKGILETLYRKHRIKLFETLRNKPSHEILKGAFNKKYGSSTLEQNRNKGLPSVKNNFEIGTILNLKVITNNVILHFDNDNHSQTFKKGSPRLRGTIYQWEMTKETISKTTK